MRAYVVVESYKAPGDLEHTNRIIGVFDNEASARAAATRRERSAPGSADEWCWCEDWEVRS